MVSSNGHFLTEENCAKIVSSGLKKLIISADGITQESYEKYRVEGNLEKVKEGIQNLALAKKNAGSKYPKIVFQFIIFKHNEQDVNEVKTWAKKLGVNKVQLKTAQVYNPETGSELLPENPKNSRYKKVNGEYVIDNKLMNHCWRLCSSSVITWDGKVVPCCFDKDATHQFGTLSEASSFNSIWKNNKYQNFRKQVLKKRKVIDICANCSEGSKVWI